MLVVHLPTDRRGVALRCGIDAGSKDLPHHLSRLRRHVQQTAHHRSSAWAIAGMVLLLAVCGWIVDGAEGAHRAMTGSMPRSGSPAISREAMHRWFGARLLRPADMPGLFKILADVCRRARLSRLPDLYHLPARGDMNAYALGDSEGLVKTIFDAESGELLGAHMIGAEVTELIQGYAIARTLESTEAELAATVFPHPTLSEMLHESVLDADKRALHI